MNLFESYLKRLVNETVKEFLSEKRLITFDNRVYPKFGWCVILAGGGGSGKGYINSHNLPIDGNVINVDDFKKLYARLKKVEYNSHNPEDVARLHKMVSQADIKGMYTDNIFNPEAHNTERLPNVIFDMTGRDPEHNVTYIARYAKEMGYKTCVVWAVANRHEALLRNLRRSRTVPDNIIHSIHNNLATNMPPFLESQLAVDYLDDAWIIFSSADNLTQSDLSGDSAKDMAVHLDKSSNGFIISNDTFARINKYVGKLEKNPLHPETYLSSKEIVDKYGTPQIDKNGNQNGYEFDRSQFNKDSNFYR